MMSEKDSQVKKKMKIGLLGASFETGNLGVSALAESSIKVILNRWPDAEITLLDAGCVVGEHRLRIGGQDLCIRKLPIRFCKNIFLENHFLVLCFYALLFKVFRWEGFKRFCTRQNASLRSIIQMDMVADITGGDSFSDIYSMRRFVQGYLRKWLVLLFDKDLVMLPQTYGPFKRRITKMMARYIVTHADLVYSRDRAGVEYVKNLLNKHTDNGKVRFAPDVAFVLDARKPEHLNMDWLIERRTKETVVVGLNISGLLFNGGYTQDNIFGLKVDYRDLVYGIIDLFMKYEKLALLLVPHVFSPHGTVESDPDACLKVYEALKDKYKNRIFLLRNRYNQNEIKYIIGMCDFFIGSRMHACIAAVSQCIPAVGLAYSKKFYGVFQSIGFEQFAIDLRSKTSDEILEASVTAFEQREASSKCLRTIIPKVQEQVQKILKETL